MLAKIKLLSDYEYLGKILGNLQDKHPVINNLPALQQSIEEALFLHQELGLEFEYLMRESQAISTKLRKINEEANESISAEAFSHIERYRALVIAGAQAEFINQLAEIQGVQVRYRRSILKKLFDLAENQIEIILTG